MQLDLFESLSNSLNSVNDVKVCAKCGESKSLDCYNKKRSVTGVDIKQSYCKDCQSEHGKVINAIHKLAPPKPNTCDCCSVEDKTLILDHDHYSGVFRGWLCYKCNSGIGALGDTVDGLSLAIAYLRKQDE